MTDDPRIRELVRAAREDEARTDELLARAERGEPAAGEEEELIRAILAKGDDERLVEVSLGAAKATPAVSDGGSTATAPPRVVPIARRRWVPAVVSGLALAAAVAVFVKTQRNPDGLPGYEPVLRGADAPDRAEPSPQGNVVSYGASLVLVAQPRERVNGEVEARAFAGCGGKLVRLDVPVVVAESGAARLEGKPEVLFGANAQGPCSLVLAIGRPGTLPESVSEATPRHAVVRVDLVVRRR